MNGRAMCSTLLKQWWRATTCPRAGSRSDEHSYAPSMQPNPWPHLRAAALALPFDLHAAGLLFQALGEANDVAGQERVARQLRLLTRAAPQTAPPESWFLTVPEPADELASIIILCCN